MLSQATAKDSIFRTSQKYDQLPYSTSQHLLAPHNSNHANIKDFLSIIMTTSAKAKLNNSNEQTNRMNFASKYEHRYNLFH